MNRRNLLATAGAFALAGCNGITLPAVPVNVNLPSDVTQLIDDANSIINKLSSLGGLTSGATALIDQGKTLIGKLSAVTSLADAQPIIGSLIPLVQSILPMLPNNGTIGTIIAAIQTVLPVMAQVAGLVSLFAATRPTGMTVNQARAILRS